MIEKIEQHAVGGRHDLLEVERGRREPVQPRPPVGFELGAARVDAGAATAAFERRVLGIEVEQRREVAVTAGIQPIHHHGDLVDIVRPWRACRRGSRRAPIVLKSTLKNLLSECSLAIETIVRNARSCASPEEYGVPNSGSPPAAPPDAERDDDRERQREPGDGVLQVVVLQMDVERARFRDAAGRHRRFQIDVERRDALPPTQPARAPSRR